MSVILHIETATDLCSVAVSQDTAIIFQTDNLPKEGDEPKKEKGGDDVVDADFTMK